MKLAKLIGAAALLLLTACGGLDGVPNTPTTGDDMAGAKSSSGGDMAEAASMSGDGGLLPLYAMCTTNDQCGSGLCTKASYDRLTMPICTYQCDANDMNPKCPMGCNPKGYCKIPM